MGHTTDRTTKEHYLIEMPEHKRRAVKRLDRQVQRLLRVTDTGSTFASERRSTQKRA